MKMSSRFSRSSFHPAHGKMRPILAGAILALAQPAFAVTLTWDSDAAAGNGATDGAGTWDTVTASWFNGAADVAWPNTVADTAIFGAGGTGGVVTLGVPITAGNLVFNPLASGNYTLGSLSDPDVETLTIGSGGAITVNAAGTTTINATILMTSAGGALAVAGAGDLRLHRVGSFGDTMPR